MALLRIVGLLVLGLSLYVWHGMAEAVATSTCDDGCGSSGEWFDDPDSSQWTTQLWIARAGVTAAIVGAGLWLLRRRHVAGIAIVAAVVLFCVWYPIADHGRFGP